MDLVDFLKNQPQKMTKEFSYPHARFMQVLILVLVWSMERLEENRRDSTGTKNQNEESDGRTGTKNRMEEQERRTARKNRKIESE